MRNLEKSQIDALDECCDRILIHSEAIRRICDQTIELLNNWPMPFNQWLKEDQEKEENKNKAA